MYMAKEAKGKKRNFFQDLISSIFGGGDPEAVKKRMLKNIAKNLQKSKFHFYKPSSHEVDATLAKFFYDIYKAISPAQLMFQNTTPNAMKSMVINSTLGEKQLEAVETLSENSINELAKKMKIKDLTEKVNESYELLSAEFSSEKIARIDLLYTKLVQFSNFCQYDFYFLLKKFDNSIKEHSFNAPPRFQNINGTYIAEDLKNFMAVAWGMPFEADWEDVFKLMRAVKGVEPVTLTVWKKILVRLRGLRDRHVLEMMVQLITEDPAWREVPRVEDLHIADDYLSETKKNMETALAQLKAKQTAGKVDSLLTQVFGTTEIPGLKNYNDTNSSVFTRKDFDGYLYAEPLSYLKQFLLEYTKKDIRELSDILLVRGDWANQQLATPMSECFHQLMDIAERIITLDNRMNEEGGEIGIKLKTLLPRSERDKEARNIIKTLLNDANEAAGSMILLSVQQFVAFDRNLKMCLEDFVKQPRSELIMNWKDLDHFAEGKLKDMCVDVYKKIYMFVQLMQTFSVELDEE